MDNQINILIVDDEAAGREALEGVLFSQGYTLIFAENGKEALQKALELIPDLILLDVMMPNMDGYEVCQRMRSDALLAEIPILLITALDDRISRIKGIESGADDFISKPFDRLELRARVRTVIRLNRYRRLLLERARFVWVAEQAKEGYVILNAKDQIKYANPAGRLLLNLPVEEKLAFSFLTWVQKQYVCQPEEAWATWLEPQLLESAFYLIRPETDFTRPVWLQVEVLSLPVGQESHRLLRISEVTEKMALYHEIWNFHKTVTHKLRTPVSNMVMAAELFQHQTAGKVAEDTQELTEMVVAGAKRVRSEIEDILSYVNLPAIAGVGKHCGLNRFTQLVLQVSQELNLDKVSVHFDPELARETTLQLSERSMQIILWEIFENARKFHPQSDPQIEVRVSQHVSGAVRMIIRDNGHTLAPEQLRQVWVPYYQAEKEFTGEVDGMGLGLSTVAKLVWEVGGKYRLSNREDGPGVSVDFIIPKETASIPLPRDLSRKTIRV